MINFKIAAPRGARGAPRGAGGFGRGAPRGGGFGRGAPRGGGGFGRGAPRGAPRGGIYNFLNFKGGFRGR